MTLFGAIHFKIFKEKLDRYIITKLIVFIHETDLINTYTLCQYITFFLLTFKTRGGAGKNKSPHYLKVKGFIPLSPNHGEEFYLL